MCTKQNYTLSESSPTSLTVVINLCMPPRDATLDTYMTSCLHVSRHKYKPHHLTLYNLEHSLSSDHHFQTSPIEDIQTINS